MSFSLPCPYAYLFIHAVKSPLKQSSQTAPVANLTSSTAKSSTKPNLTFLEAAYLVLGDVEEGEDGQVDDGPRDGLLVCVLQVEVFQGGLKSGKGSIGQDQLVLRQLKGAKEEEKERRKNRRKRKRKQRD